MTRANKLVANILINEINYNSIVYLRLIIKIYILIEQNLIIYLSSIILCLCLLFKFLIVQS